MSEPYVTGHRPDSAKATRVHKHEPSHRPISVSVRTACELSGLGRSTIWQAISEGRLETVKVGKKRLILFDDLERFIRGKPAA